MPASEENTAGPIKPVQYSMRSLLVLMGVMAIVAAVAGSYYRQCSPETRPNLLVLWSTSLISMAGSFWSLERGRLKSCSGAGMSLIRLPNVHYHIWASSGYYNLGSLFFFLMGICMLIFHSTECEKISSQHFSNLLFSAMRGLQTGFYALPGLFMFQAGDDVRLCENGVLSKQRLIKWTDISRITPNLGTEHDDRTVYSIKGNPMFRVPPELREQVDALIAEKLADKDARG